MIEVRKLVKNFEGKPALRGISFRVEPGTATGYLGPNGAGKSTTVKILAGLLAPTEGDAVVAGFDVREAPLEAKRRLGYVPENAALYSGLTPHEYLSLVAELYELDRAVAADRIRRLMDAFQVADAVGRRIETLSKGNRQKVLIAGALLHEPDVLILDEPLNGLDVNASLALRQIVAGLLERGRTVLYCSHILDVIERLCQRVIVIDQGMIVANDTTVNLLRQTPQGTLESVFRMLTRKQDADEATQNFLAALDGKPALGPNQPPAPAPAAAAAPGRSKKDKGKRR